MIKDVGNNGRRASSAGKDPKTSEVKLIANPSRDIITLIDKKKKSVEVSDKTKSSPRTDLLLRNPGRKSILSINRNSYSPPKRSSVDSSKLTADIFQVKINRIDDLEFVIKEIKECLICFFMDLKDILVLDEDFDVELKNLLFKPFIVEAIKSNDPHQIIEMLRNIILGALNLRQSLKKIDAKDFKEDIPEDERDYILLYQKLELEHKNSQRREEESKYILEITKSQLREYEKQNKIIIEQTKKIVNDFRMDYQKLLDVLRDRESDMKEYQRDLSKKTEKINFQEERLMSLYVLEHKIQVLGLNNQTEIRKIKNNFEKQLKEQTQLSRIAPNHVSLKEELEKKITHLEKELKYKEFEKTSSRNWQEIAVNSLKSQLDEQSKSILQKDKEMIFLKDKLSDSNKSVQILLHTTESLKKQHEQSQTMRFKKQDYKSNNLKEFAQSRPNTSVLTPLKYSANISGYSKYSNL